MTFGMVSHSRADDAEFSRIPPPEVSLDQPFTLSPSARSSNGADTSDSPAGADTFRAAVELPDDPNAFRPGPVSDIQVSLAKKDAAETAIARSLGATTLNCDPEYRTYDQIQNTAGSVTDYGHNPFLKPTADKYYKQTVPYQTAPEIQKNIDDYVTRGGGRHASDLTVESHTGGKVIKLSNEKFADSIRTWVRQNYPKNVTGAQLKSVCPNYDTIPDKGDFWIALMESITKEESGFQVNNVFPEPTMHYDSLGLMQISFPQDQACHKFMNTRNDAFDPLKNIQCSLQIMTDLTTKSPGQPLISSPGQSGKEGQGVIGKYWSTVRNSNPASKDFRAEFKHRAGAFCQVP